MNTRDNVVLKWRELKLTPFTVDSNLGSLDSMFESFQKKMQELLWKQKELKSFVIKLHATLVVHNTWELSLKNSAFYHFRDHPTLEQKNTKDIIQSATTLWTKFIVFPSFWWKFKFNWEENNSNELWSAADGEAWRDRKFWQIEARACGRNIVAAGAAAINYGYGVSTSLRSESCQLKRENIVPNSSIINGSW